MKCFKTDFDPTKNACNIYKIKLNKKKKILSQILLQQLYIKFTLMCKYKYIFFYISQTHLMNTCSARLIIIIKILFVNKQQKAIYICLLSCKKKKK